MGSDLETRKANKNNNNNGAKAAGFGFGAGAAAAQVGGLLEALKEAESQLKAAKGKNAKTKTVTQKQTIKQTVTASVTASVTAAAAAVSNNTVTYVNRFQCWLETWPGGIPHLDE